MERGVRDPKISVFSVVRRLREQRWLMVQIDDQYVYLHAFIAKWIAVYVLSEKNLAKKAIPEEPA